MLCIWWDYQGVIHFEILKCKETVNSKLNCVQLEMVNEKLLKIHPALVNRRGVLFLHDNAKLILLQWHRKNRTFSITRNIGRLFILNEWQNTFTYRFKIILCLLFVQNIEEYNNNIVFLNKVSDFIKHG